MAWCLVKAQGQLYPFFLPLLLLSNLEVPSYDPGSEMDYHA
jgi:hypothetical protein